ncbi:MAG: sigma 54-interacting transcriptional regulator, partial [Mucilaginibacter sp.]|uniref:sigma 54-interacting transcriptional regulator n=1 Tax=Mucilaginibacter sp. TaxID=1882438 RepID=UPI0031B1F756
MHSNPSVLNSVATNIEDIPLQLDHFRSVMNADYLQLLFEQSSKGLFKNSLVDKTPSLQYPVEEAEHLDLIVQIAMANEQQIISRDELQDHGMLSSNSAFPFQYIVVLPLFSEEIKMGVMFLGYISRQPLLDMDISIFSNDLAEYLFNLSGKKAVKERLYLLTLGERLRNVKTKPQLCDLLKRQVHQELGIITSALFDFKEGAQMPGVNWFETATNQVDLDLLSLFYSNGMISGVIDSYKEQSKMGYGWYANLNTTPNLCKELLKLKEKGIGGVIVQPLFHDCKIARIWVLLTNADSLTWLADTHLLTLIGGQLIATVNTIDAKECQDLSVAEKRRFNRWEAEKELLVSLSKSLAATRNQADLIHVLNERIKPVFDCSHVVICTIDKETGHVKPTFLDPQSANCNDPRYQQISTDMYPMNNGHWDVTANSAIPSAFNLVDWVNLIDCPPYFKLNYDNGIKQMISIRLKCFDTLIGFWNICFSELRHWDASTLNLMQGIAEQISIAMSNILANETLEKREFEKSTLLSISNALSKARNKEEINKVFSYHLQKLFGSVQYSLHWLCEDQSYHYSYLWDSEVMAEGSPGAYQMYTAKYPVNDGVFDQVKATGQMILIDINKENERANCPTYLQFAKLHNFTHALAFPVYVGEEMPGVLFANFKKILEQEQKLVSCICSQLAVSVSNLIASEKVIRQFEEIKRYKQQLEEERIYLKEELETSNNYSEMVGNTECLREVFKLVSQVAATDSTVLILGETGTGKELVARAIHQESKRKEKLIVKINCAALPPNLIESELFGHEKGSFTGAVERRVGKFELASGGTLFLDEIGELPLELQSKLLRVLQEKEIERVGGKTTIPVDVRIIAATNRSLLHEVEAGRFRKDLYY